jgi:TRAP-type C4-dicarboxylate transport system permease small subunit
VRRALETVAAWMALAGGAVLLAIVALTCASVIGRWLAATPIVGDVELVQAGCAIAIALFLPYCQLHGAHLTVDFFTVRATAGTRLGLDRLAHLASAAIFFLLAWRAAIALMDARAAGETTMLLALPLWWPLVALIVGLGGAGLVACVMYADAGRAPLAD